MEWNWRQVDSGKIKLIERVEYHFDAGSLSLTQIDYRILRLN